MRVHPSVIGFLAVTSRRLFPRRFRERVPTRSAVALLAACGIAATVFFSPTTATAQDEDEQCMDCHEDRTLVTEMDGQEISLFIEYELFKRSIHGEEGCISCHEDIDVDNLPHEETLAKVECETCHDDATSAFRASLHGQALEQGKYLAPSCITCHSKHNVLPGSDERSWTYVMNIPRLCGSCHKEGTSVSELRTIEQRQILENYSESIHGDGLFLRGLIVTAVCTSCHFSHNILPHENPNSSINRFRIAETCMQCHRQIESVHQKVIDGKLWEEAPHAIPACIDCHEPHNVRRVFYEESFPNRLCMSCHADQGLTRAVDGETTSLYVDATEVKQSIHGTTTCVSCHTNVSVTRDPICIDGGPVDCSMCHPAEVTEFEGSVHGKNLADGNPIAPNCTDCHGSHDTMGRTDPNSPIFARRIPDLCGRCHREGQKAAVAYTGQERDIIQNYTMNIHGKGLLQSGLMVTATCIDCHTAHGELPSSDSRSTVHADNIADTCAKCHLGIYEEFRASVHSPDVTNTDNKLPACHDCHQSHTINRVDFVSFRQGILDQCGNCHLDVTETYFDTFHGKVSKLGSAATAKCYDCHGAHNILPTSNPASTLSRANVVETCRQCHPNSNRKFVGYLTHATHHDKDKYPFLFYTFWGMTGLLVVVFTVFGLHTLLWIPRAIYERRRNGKRPVKR